MDLIQLIIWIIRALTNPERGRQKETGGGTGERPPVLVRSPFHRDVVRKLERLGLVEGRVRRLAGTLSDLHEDLRRRLEPVLADGALPLIEEVRASLQELSEELVPSVPIGVNQNLELLEILAGVLEEIVRQRHDPETRAVLGDADALAEACYRPILDFAAAHGLAVSSHHPMTFFHPTGAFVDLAFSPFQIAPIALPTALAREPWWWPAIAHEIGHDFLATVPDLSRELVQVLDLQRRDSGEPLRFGSDDFHRAFFGTWIGEIFADAVGVLMIGPAYLRSMTTLFARSRQPEQVTAIRISADGIIDSHPPRHLRVHMTAAFLDRMGFGRAAHAMVEKWNTVHNSPEALWLVTPEDSQPLPLAPLLQFSDMLMEQLYLAQLQTLAGHRLADVPGLGFAATHQRRAEAARQQFGAGLPAAFDARSLIAAATEAALAQPESTAAVQKAMGLSVVGVGTGERPASVRAMARARVGRTGGILGRPLTTRRLVDALLLGEILERRAAGRSSVPANRSTAPAAG